MISNSVSILLTSNSCHLVCVRFFVCLLEGRGRRKGHFLTSLSQFSRKGKLRSVKYGNEIHYYDNCSNQDSMCKACMQMCSCCSSFYLKVHLAFKIMWSKKAKEGKNIKSGIRSCLRISTKSRLWLSEKRIILILNRSFCFDHKGKPQVMHCCPHMALCRYHFKSIVFWNVARPADPDVRSRQHASLCEGFGIFFYLQFFHFCQRVQLLLSHLHRNLSSSQWSLGFICVFPFTPF